MQTFVETGEPALDPHSQALVRARAKRPQNSRKADSLSISHIADLTGSAGPAAPSRR